MEDENMNAKAIFGATCLLVATCAAQAATDCSMSDSFLVAARRESDSDRAAHAAQRAADSCPSYEAYELLGELRARSLDRQKQAQAVDAFLSANDLAVTDPERATTLFHYSELLFRDGDPQSAYPLILQARGLEPGNAQIGDLATQIEDRINHPRKEDLVRGLWQSMYKPLRIASLTPTSVAMATSATEEKHAEAAAASAKSSAPGRSVLIPIHFDTGSARVDAETRHNVTVLASALAGPEFTSQRFIFVGHADIRGNEADNVILSKRRAETLADAVVMLQPSLEGRIDSLGRGSSEPLDPARNEAAYRVNRRLQVILK
jgi:outer membrane protein OmpA-like peptidoglycan-associated protein